MGKTYISLLLILLTLPYNSVGLEINHDGLSVPSTDIDSPESPSHVNQTIKEINLTNSSLYDLNLSLSYGEVYVDDIRGVDLFNISYFFESTLLIGFNMTLEAHSYILDPLSNSSSLSIAYNHDLASNLYLDFTIRTGVKGTLLGQNVSLEYNFAKNVSVNYPISLGNIDISLLDIPVLGNYLKQFSSLRFDLSTEGEFKQNGIELYGGVNFSFYSNFNPYIVLGTEVLYRSEINNQTMADLTLGRIEEPYVKTYSYNNLANQIDLEQNASLIGSLSQRLDINSEISFNLTSNAFDYSFQSKFDPVQINSSILEIAIISSTKEVLVQIMDGVQNIMKSTVFTLEQNYTLLGFNISGGLELNLPNNVVIGYSLNLSTDIRANISHRFAYLYPLIVNNNSIYDIKIFPVRSEASMVGELNIVLSLNWNATKFSRLIRKNLSGVIGITPGNNDIRSVISPWLGQIYNWTSTKIDLTKKGVNSSLNIEFIPYMALEYDLFSNLNSSKMDGFASIRDTVTTMRTTVRDGTIYNKYLIENNIFGNISPVGGVLPKISLEVSKGKRDISVPIPSSFRFETRVKQSNISEIIKLEPEMYFMDVDVVPPTIKSEQGSDWYYSVIGDRARFDIWDDQSGIANITVVGYSSYFLYENNTLIVTMDRAISGNLVIQARDYANNTQSFLFHFSYDDRSDSTFDAPVREESTSNDPQYYLFIPIVVIGALIYVSNNNKRNW